MEGALWFEKLFFRVRHCEFMFQWACGIELRLRVTGVLSFCRDVIFSTHIRVFRCRLTVFLLKKMSRSPSPSSSSESLYGYSEESEQESFPEKPLLEIGRYDDSVEPVPTEYRIPWAACLGRGGKADLIKSFFRGGRHQRLVCIPCYEIQKLTNRENKRMIECVYWVSIFLLQSSPQA